MEIVCFQKSQSSKKWKESRISASMTFSYVFEFSVRKEKINDEIDVINIEQELVYLIQLEFLSSIHDQP